MKSLAVVAILMLNGIYAHAWGPSCEDLLNPKNNFVYGVRQGETFAMAKAVSILESKSGGWLRTLVQKTLSFFKAPAKVDIFVAEVDGDTLMLVGDPAFNRMLLYRLPSGSDAPQMQMIGEYAELAKSTTLRYRSSGENPNEALNPIDEVVLKRYEHNVFYDGVAVPTKTYYGLTVKTRGGTETIEMSLFKSGPNFNLPVVRTQNIFDWELNSPPAKTNPAYKNLKPVESKK